MNLEDKGLGQGGRSQTHSPARPLLRYGLVVLLFAAAGLAIGYIFLSGHLQQIEEFDKVSADIQAIELALKTYADAGGQGFPTTEQGLKALVDKPAGEPSPGSWRKIFVQVPRDPWGQRYQYRCPSERFGAEYDLWSRGPDGVSGTADDIGNWE